MAKADNTPKEYELGSAEMLFPSPAVKHDLSYLGDQYKGAYIEYIPFQGVDVIALETIPQTKATSSFYTLLEKYFVGGQMPRKQADNSFALQDLDRKDLRQIPYSIVLKLIQSALQGELPENFTTTSKEQ